MTFNVQRYVHRNESEAPDSRLIEPHPDRPATAQRTRNTHELNGHISYETNTDNFDASVLSPDEQQQIGSDDSQGQDDYDYGHYAEQGTQDYQENGIPAGFDVTPSQISGMMMEMNQNGMQRAANRPMYIDPESYPPTTDGDPESLNNFEPDNGYEVRHMQAQSQVVQQALDTFEVEDPQRRDATTSLPVHPLQRRTHKNQFMARVTPTVTQRDIQDQKKTRDETRAIAESVVQVAAESFKAATQHSAAQRPPVRAPIQPKRASVEPYGHDDQYSNSDLDPELNNYREFSNGTNRRQTCVNGADVQQQQLNGKGHKQQRLNGRGHKQQQLDGTSYKQQQQNFNEASEEISKQELSFEGLDYDKEKLKKMDFDALQREPFDGPTREDAQEDLSDLASKSLNERLSAVAKFDAQRQKEFFASLSIEEWEEAGDWFQESFSGVMNNLKAARRKRRELALEFENRVAQRQQAIEKKHGITEEALVGMKRSGSQVLVSTPKKKHKSSG
ncbi:hypothetical protein E4T42_02409 [Aureobasidium subglaciale]|uniref:Extracellular mutant protein 11 C-terminal domain-containing protein n=1 Tax=Aureobasidium subglaciale (strain EXF-2481) TaxID=1043005 RepID=A0A074Y9V2_AURSE|nr:uncharacterized protein AUEXF2481DRAFT_41147 [Aureobasidium subglaciale EXF-2481]KAI5196708.1 hypothetical protein E4T38_08326 [Aureobasidium subglaciale]KAI5213504.1 hypothetical protein E4T40_09653 [Aureobasidium subglaciale]KAI5215180.1 hypothetical protein E4T41_09691 [Aureobasidium subglaciale]KAI5254320.1 hypothetical protein E4T42_02409 [Aureobasidium subglaciale]KAI5256453.1 hypothetical protein E4T46_08226 [Aureobasidium subglaciale]